MRTDGKIARIDESRSLPDELVERCVKDAFTRLTFPRPKSGTVKVQYPLILGTD